MGCSPDKTRFGVTLLKKMKALFLRKICEVSQIRSLTLNRLGGERILLQTTTEKLLLQSPLTTNNSDRVCFRNKQSTLKHTSVVVTLLLMFLLLHFPSSGGREGPPFYKGNFRALCMVARFRAATVCDKGRSALEESKLQPASWSCCQLLISFVLGIIATFVWIFWD